MADEKTDVLIAGGGFAGLTLAIALRQALGPSFAVTVADPALGVSHANDERASAIVAAARRLFETIGVWDAVAGQAQPILDMVITDSRLADAMRPVFLTFAGEVEPEITRDLEPGLIRDAANRQPAHAAQRSQRPPEMQHQVRHGAATADHSGVSG